MSKQFLSVLLWSIASPLLMAPNATAQAQSSDPAEPAPVIPAPVQPAPVIPVRVRPTIDRVVSIQTGSGQGSGVIIKHEGDTYTILTAAHVVANRHNRSIKIVTFDRQEHTTPIDRIQIAPNAIDLATVTFQSTQNYPVAQIGDSSTLGRGQAIFAAGFLNTAVRSYPGKVVAIGRQLHPYGYSLVLGNADILPGMSGGGVFNDTGILVGINAKSVGNTNANHSNRLDLVKPVSGLAIPIDTFVKVASQMQVDLGTRPPIVAKSSSNADDLFVAAQHKSERGNYQAAIDDYDSTLVLNPNFTEVYFRRGIAHSSLQHWPEAMADYTRSISIAPNHSEAYIHRGNIRNILADWRGAKSDFNVAIGINPYNAAAYIGRGQALCELNDCQLALNDYRRAISLNPTSAYAYNSRGFAYYRLGNKKNAISSYLTAAELYRQAGKDRDYLDTVQKIKELVKR
jgi:S1-C subfamily serine protease/lipoprotein NlpI